MVLYSYLREQCQVRITRNKYLQTHKTGHRKPLLLYQLEYEKRLPQGAQAGGDSRLVKRLCSFFVHLPTVENQQGRPTANEGYPLSQASKSCPERSAVRKDVREREFAESDLEDDEDEDEDGMTDVYPLPC